MKYQAIFEFDCEIKLPEMSASGMDAVDELLNAMDLIPAFDEADKADPSSLTFCFRKKGD